MLDLVLVIDDVVVCPHVGAVLDVDGETISDPDQRLVNGRRGVPSALDTKKRLGRQRGPKVAQIDLSRKLTEAIWHMLHLI